MHRLARKLLLLVLAAGLFFPSMAAQAQEKFLNVYFAGPDGGVRTALSLDKNVAFVTDPAQADVFVLNGIIPPADSAAIRARVEAGAGLVLVLGPQLTARAVEDMLGQPVSLEQKDDALSLVPVAGSQDSLVKSVLWTSAPQVRERFALTGGGLTPLVTGFEDGSLVLGKSSIGSGQAFVLTAFLGDANGEFQQWPYFNYLVYHLAGRAAGRMPSELRRLSRLAGPAPPRPGYPGGVDGARAGDSLPGLLAGAALQPGSSRRAGCHRDRPGGVRRQGVRIPPGRRSASTARWADSS